MNQYKVITKQNSEKFAETLLYATTDVAASLSERSRGANALIIEDELYAQVIAHPSFVGIYCHNASVCPVAKAFLLNGVWYVSASEVHPLVVALDSMKQPEEEK